MLTRQPEGSILSIGEDCMFKPELKQIGRNIEVEIFDDIVPCQTKIDSPTLRALDEYFKEWGPRDPSLFKKSY